MGRRGLYQVGTFVGDTWKEWNGRFRDDVRRLLPGRRRARSRAGRSAARQPGDLRSQEREAEQSVNFVTCHDGFTLNDFVSYDAKHNEANGEDNRDGTNDNQQLELRRRGPDGRPGVEALRNRQVKNLLAVCSCLLGTPMLLMGDEMRRTQRGNNNAYCQDENHQLARLEPARATR